MEVRERSPGARRRPPREEGGEDGPAQGGRRRPHLPGHRPRGQGRDHRQAAARERDTAGHAGSFKRTRPWLFDEQGEGPADRVAEGEHPKALGRTHRFLEDLEEFL